MTGTPFLFDNNVFDDDANLNTKNEDDAPEIPEFTKTALQNEKTESFNDGKKSGFKESETGISKNALNVLGEIENNISMLFDNEEARIKKYEEEALHLSLHIIEQLFPLYTEEFGNDKLQKAIKDALCNHDTPKIIEITLHENVMPSIESYIKQLGSELGKNITITPTSSCDENECQILWPEGGIIYSHSKVAKKTLTIMKEALAERGVNVHDEKLCDDNKNNETGDA